MQRQSSTEKFRAARDLLLKHREDYQAACDAFRWPHFEHFNWAIDWFDAVLAGPGNGDRPALRVIGDEAGEWTFADLSRQSNQVANLLDGLGVARGDRILLMAGNIAPLLVVMLAIMKLGAVAIPATTLLTAHDVADRVKRGKVRAVVATSDIAARLSDLPPNLIRIAIGEAVPGWAGYAEAEKASPDFRPLGNTRASDPLFLYFTSGTTAQPKLVMHSHASYPVGHLSTMYWIGLQPGDVHLNVSSPGWAKHAWSSLFAPWNAGATIVFLNHGRFDARAMLDVLVEQDVTTLCAPPTVWRMLIQEDLSKWKVRLREVCAAGEPLNPGVIGRVADAWGLTIRDGFGQTETTAQIGNSPGQPNKIGSMGRPLPGYAITLLNEEGEEGDEGEISILLGRYRPTGLMAGYLIEDGAVSAPAGLAYRTGDIAVRDADGYITYVGRADDVFKASDYRISPFELESALIEHPMIVEAAVIPAPDPVRLAVPKAVVSLANGVEPGEDTARVIFTFIKERLAPYKRIRRLEFAELPKTISGKIRRVQLRQAEDGKKGSRAALEFYEEDFPELRS